MTARTYTPSGTGLCATCGHDVGRVLRCPKEAAHD